MVRMVHRCWFDPGFIFRGKRDAVSCSRSFARSSEAEKLPDGHMESIATTQVQLGQYVDGSVNRREPGEERV